MIGSLIDSTQPFSFAPQEQVVHILVVYCQLGEYCQVHGSLLGSCYCPKVYRLLRFSLEFQCGEMQR